MKRHDGGYVLVYVVVVIVVLCILIPAACSNSLKNLKAQQTSIERMRQLYTAEGQIERFTAELKASAEKVRAQAENNSDPVEAAKDAFAASVSTIAQGIPGSELTGGENFSPGWRNENGNPRCGLSLVSTAGSVTVNADIQVELEIKPDDGATYKITRCTITYISYDISATAETENAGEEGGNPP